VADWGDGMSVCCKPWVQFFAYAGNRCNYCILHCGIISSCQSAATYEIVKALLVTSSSHVKSTTACTGLKLITLPLGQSCVVMYCKSNVLIGPTAYSNASNMLLILITQANRAALPTGMLQCQNKSKFKIKHYHCYHFLQSLLFFSYFLQQTPHICTRSN